MPDWSGMRPRWATFGPEFTGATSSWVACPPEAILDYDGLIAYCMSEFGKGRTRRFVSATIEEDLVAEISVNRQWTRKWRRCGSGHLKHLGLDGADRPVRAMLALNFRITVLTAENPVRIRS